jgi:NADPH-dependent ferric siderophore reductase
MADEAGLPAVAAVAEALPGPIRVLAEIADDAEHYPMPSNAEVTWLLRGDRPAGSAEIFLAELDDLAPRSGSGYAYVLGESRAVVAVRDALGRLGLDRSSVYAKGYWNLNSRSTR